MNKKSLFIGILVVAVVVGAGFWFKHTNQSSNSTSTGTPAFTPIPSASTTPSPSAQASITLTSPAQNADVDSPILVTGRARVFENQLTIQLKDDKGNVVNSVHVFTDAKDAGQFGNFSARVIVPGETATPTMKVEALAPSPKGDGSLQGYAAATVKLKYTDTTTVYAAFTTNPNDCTAVTLFPREITKTSQFVYMSIAELLKGPGGPEVASGATTQLPSGVEINSFHQTGDTAYVDFNQTLQQGVAGSCRVQGIRAQIESTLKQFLGINNVVISVNGQTNGILQP